jgi:hypothetical protein
MFRKYTVAVSIIMTAFMLAGCSDYGQVDQGRVIEFDKANKTLTMIRDKSLDPKKPDYSHLPPVTYKLPDDPNEMGPDPRAGKRMKLDLEKKQIVIYVPNLKDFTTINYTVVEQKIVDPDDPLVFDKLTNKPRNFPEINQQKKTISIYSKRQKTLVTFSVPEQYFAFPIDTWDNGDEVRIYYKEEGKARRLMNITKTNIFKK